MNISGIYVCVLPKLFVLHTLG